MSNTGLPLNATMDDVDLTPLCLQVETKETKKDEISLERFSDLVFEALRPHREAFAAVNQALRLWYREHSPHPVHT